MSIFAALGALFNGNPVDTQDFATQQAAAFQRRRNGLGGDLGSGEGLRGEKILRAKALLGVGPDATPAEIRTAFAAKVKDAHPDTGSGGDDIYAIKAARNLLLESAQTQRLPSDNNAATRCCQMCGGSGRVAVGFDNQRCTTCDGKGEVTC